MSRKCSRSSTCVTAPTIRVLESVSPADVEHLKSDREIQEYFLNLIQLSIFEIAWYAHKHGQLPHDYFQSWTTRMWQVAQEKSFRSMIDNPSMKIVHDEFDRFVRRLIAAPSPPGKTAVR